MAYETLLIRPTRLICGFHCGAFFAFSPPPKIDARIDWDDPRTRRKRWAKDKCSFWAIISSERDRASFFGARAKNWTNSWRRFNCHLPQFTGRMKHLVSQYTNYKHSNTKIGKTFTVLDTKVTIYNQISIKHMQKITY